MDSRYSAEENVRAAEIAYVPGGALSVPDNALGDGRWTLAAVPFPRYFDGRRQVGRAAESILQRSVAATRSTESFASIPLFDGVPDANAAFMNQRVTSKRKSFLPPEQISVSQPYPDPPPVWQMWIGAPTRFDLR
jgi:hypothetical protein